MPDALTIRRATPVDVPALLTLVRELAEYEREPDAVEATEEHFAEALFGQRGGTGADSGHQSGTGSGGDESDAGDGARGSSQALVAEVAGEVVGMAVWYVTFSTWTGRHGIWLEDLYVRPGHRGSGIGRALLGTLASTAVERGWARLEWWVLRWNAPSIGFYEGLGARAMDEWVHYRMEGDQLRALAATTGAVTG
jgi:GNAT superfamily N-acetyltransferase